MTNKAVQLPTPDTPPRKALALEEVLALAEAARAHPLGVGFLLALYAGLRRGEVVGLRWQDVDFRRDILYACGQWRWSPRQNEEQPGKWTYGRPKNPKTAHEEIPLLPELRTALLEERARQEGWAATPDTGFVPQGWVLAQPNGEPYNPNHLAYAFEQLARQLQLPHHHLHACRHALCVHLLRSGVPVQTVSRIMRHSDPGFTLRVYGHEIPGERHAAVAALGRSLEQARCNPQPAAETPDQDPKSCAVQPTLRG